MSAPSVFISYSHKDEEWKDRLVTHLGVLEQAGILDLWEDRRIEAGDDWKPEIEKAIQNASIAILMISANFLTSKFILGQEVPKLLERREKEGVRVVPLIIKPCAWMQVEWLSKMQARPKNGRPLSSGNEHQIDSDLAEIAEEIANFAAHTETAITKTNSFIDNSSKANNHSLRFPEQKIFDIENKIKSLADFGDYGRAYQECANAFSSNSYFPLLDLLIVITLLQNKGIERLSEENISKVQKHLLRACGHEETRRTALLILGYIKYDYYYVHGEYEQEPSISQIKNELRSETNKELRYDLIRYVKASEGAVKYFGIAVQ